MTFSSNARLRDQFVADHVAVRVPNLEETIQWYEQKLGFTVVTRWHDATGLDAAYLNLNGFWVEVLAGDSPPRNASIPTSVKDHLQVQGWRHLCFRVENVDQVIDFLRAQEVRILSEPQDNAPIKRRIALILDNNGNVIEFAQPLS